jgi:methylglyoxal synthase
MNKKKSIALVAHDHKKKDLIEWIDKNIDILREHNLYATGTTGVLIEKKTGISVSKFKSGPIGGDQQIGAAIVEKKIDVLIFFWDPLESQPHDPDIKALLRVAALWDTIVACNYSTADFIINSPLMSCKYDRNLSRVEDYTKDRKLD